MSHMAAERGGCTPGCRCRCAQPCCGCHVPTRVDPACSMRPGIRCSMCGRSAYAQKVESQLQGRPIVLLWCPGCDEASPSEKATA